jgi:hypothetical protein
MKRRKTKTATDRIQSTTINPTKDDVFGAPMEQNKDDRPIFLKRASKITRFKPKTP